MVSFWSLTQLLLLLVTRDFVESNITDTSQCIGSIINAERHHNQESFYIGFSHGNYFPVFADTILSILLNPSDPALQWTNLVVSKCVVSFADAANIKIYILVLHSMKLYYGYGVQVKEIIMDGKCDPLMWNPNAIFITLLDSRGMNQSYDSAVKEIIAELWVHVAYRALVIIIENDYMKAFTADPWSKDNECGKYPNNIYQIPPDTPCTPEAMVPNIERFVFPNCELKVSGRETVPFCFENSLGEFEGLDAELVRLMAGRSNLSVAWSSRVSPQSGNSMSSAHAYYQNMTRNELDVAIGGAVIMSDYFFNISYGKSHATQYLIFYVADAPPPPIWITVYTMFTLSTWIGIIITFVISVLLLIVYDKWAAYIKIQEIAPVDDKTSGNALLIVFSVLLERGVVIPTADSIRIAFAGLILYSFAISSLYVSLLHSNTLDPPKAREILSLEQLIDANLSVSVSDTNTKFIRNISSGDTLRALKHFIPNHGLVKGVEELNEYRNFTLLERDMAMDYMMAHGQYAIHRIDYKVTSINNALVIPKGSLYYNRMNRYLTASMEYGFNKVWLSETRRNSFKRRLSDGDGHQVLTLHQLAAVFVLMLTGYGVSAVAFICELFIPWLLKKYRKENA